MITKFRPRTLHNVPFTELMNDLIGPNIGQFLGTDDLALFRPKVNIVESPEKFTISIEAPGFKKEQLTIANEKETLTVKGERSENVMNENERFTRREFRSGSFERTFTLPTTVDLDGITAEYVDGVLNVRIPKKAEVKPATRAISIS